jgi:hypothetical protein
MSTNNTYLAVFLGSKTSPRRVAWDALPEGDRRAKEREGMAAWKAWVEKHHAAIVSMGGPLGKTKKVTQRGIDDTSNDMGAFTVVRADSHEAAAKLFDRHPHFSIFPGRFRRDHARAAHSRRLGEGSARGVICTWSLPARTASSSCDFDNTGARNRRRTNHAQHRATPSSLGHETREGLSRVHRARRDGQVARAEWRFAGDYGVTRIRPGSLLPPGDGDQCTAVNLA